MNAVTIILDATMQVLEEAHAMINDLNSAYGADQPHEVCRKIEKNLLVLRDLKKALDD